MSFVVFGWNETNTEIRTQRPCAAIYSSTQQRCTSLWCYSSTSWLFSWVFSTASTLGTCEEGTYGCYATRLVKKFARLYHAQQQDRRLIKFWKLISGRKHWATACAVKIYTEHVHVPHVVWTQQLIKYWNTPIIQCIFVHTLHCTYSEVLLILFSYHYSRGLLNVINRIRSAESC